jgi:3-oxoadipate enol-lactonase
MNREEKGRREYLALIGSAPEEALAGVQRQSPYLFDTVIAGAFGGALARPELDRATREIATIAMVAALGGAERQLATHAKAALRHGLAASELVALCEHVSVYAGMPRALNALAAVNQALGEAGVTRMPTLQKVRLTDHDTIVASAGDNGPAVVLVHALGLDWRMWEAMMTRLTPGRRVFAYDIRGHGWAAGSPAPSAMDQAGADLIGVLDALGLTRAHVVGLSYGGGIAQTAAVAHPDRFDSLALLGTTDFPFEAFEARAHAAETEGMAAQVIPSLTRWFTPEAIAVNPWGVRYAREHILRDDPADWAGAWRAFKSLDVQRRLAGFTPPVLVLAGELDASCPPDLMNGVAERIPGSSFRVLPDTPHMMSLEHPEAVANALEKFLPSAL